MRILKHLKRKERQVLGRTELAEHEIDCSSAPMKIVAGTAKGSLKAVEKIHRQEKNDTSNRSWSLPLVLMKKKDWFTKLCVDSRKLNDLSSVGD